MTESNACNHLTGVVLAAQAVDEQGEFGDYLRFTVDLEEGMLDIRPAGQRKDIVWMVPLADVEEALRALKRWNGSR